MGGDAIKKNTALLGGISFLTEFKLYAAVLALYFSHVAGSMAVGMSVFSISMVAVTVFELPTGLISDSVGRKKTLVWGAVASLACAVCYAWGRNVAVLYIGAVLEGLSIALFSGNNDALLYDLLKSEGKEEKYKFYLGKINALAHSALAIASVLGGVILHLSSYAAIMWLSVIPKCICVLLALAVDEPKTSSAAERSFCLDMLGEIRQAIKDNRKLMKLILADGLAGGAGEASYQFRSLFLQMVWPLWAIGFASTLSNIGASISFWFSGNIIQKLGAKRVIIGEKLYSLCCNVASYAMSNVLSPFLLNSTSLLFGVTSVAQNDLAQNLYTNQLRASLASVKSLVFSVFYAGFAVAIGWLGDHYGIKAALLLFQLVNVVSILLYFDILSGVKKTAQS